MDTPMLFELQTAKAIEYLLAVAFLALFVPFWRYVSPRATARAAATVPKPVEVFQAATAVPERVTDAGWFHVPDGVALHPGHAWVRAEPDGNVVVGLDDFARAVIGSVREIEMPAVGSMIRQGEPAWTVRGAAGPLPIVSPVDGMVVATNPEADSGAFESDPYGGGWLMRVHAPRFASNIKQLLSGSAARAWMEDVAARLRATVAPELGPSAADGGVPVHGIAGEVGPEVWKRIGREFFFAEDVPSSADTRPLDGEPQERGR